MKDWLKTMPAFVIGLAIAVGPIAAQADDSQAEQRFCANVAALNAHLSQLENISGRSTVTEVRTTAGHVEADANSMKKATQKMTTPAATQLEGAVTQLKQEVNGVSTEAELNKAREKIRAHAREAYSAGKELAAQSRCE
jgi:hypothetical protein